MAADWIGISSTHYDSHCGEDVAHPLADALDGADYWQHAVNETHWFIVDLGQAYSVQKIRGRSSRSYDPIDVNVYVNDTGEAPWGDAVAANITTWRNAIAWVEIDSTNKNGQFVKVEIIETENVDHYIGWGAATSFPIFDVYGEVVPVEPSTFTLAVELHAPTIVIDCTVFPNTLELTVTLETPEITTAVVVTPDTFALALSQNAPSLNLDYTILLDSALELGLTLQTSTVFPIVTITPDSLALAVALLSPVVVIDVTVTPDAFALALTQHAPSIATDMIVFPAVFELEATLHAPETISRYISIPPFMQKDLIDPFASGAWLWLVQIAVPGELTVRIARDTADVHYDGNDFDKFNLQIGEQIFSSDGSIPRVTLRVFQDINRKVEDLINETEGALGAQMKLIRVNEKFLTSPVSALEFDYDNLASESDSEWCTFTLGIPNPLTQRYPLRNYSSSMCSWANPELFKGPDCQLPLEHEDTTCTGTYEDCYVKGNAVHWGAELGLSPSVVTKVNR